MWYPLFFVSHLYRAEQFVSLWVIKASLIKVSFMENSLVGQWLALDALPAGAQVQSLVGELRSYNMCSMAKRRKR